MPARRAAAFCAVAVSGCLAMGVAGCSPARPPVADITSQATPAAPPAVAPSTTAAAPAATPAPARTAKWTALEAGDCLQGLPPTDPAVVTVALVDCAAPHRAEVFLRAKVPVNAAVTDTANGECEAGFAAYTGMPQVGSPYTIVYLIDSEQDRTFNNPYPSSVICLLQGVDGGWLTGSARR